MLCPNCEQLRDPMDERQLKRQHRVDKYAHETNVIYLCVKKTGGCGHLFSPGEQEIIAAYLRGDLVPAEHLKNNDKEAEAVKNR